jgi:hypothetical protein
MRHFAAQKLATGFANSESKLRLRLRSASGFLPLFSEESLFAHKLPEVSEVR